MGDSSSGAMMDTKKEKDSGGSFISEETKSKWRQQGCGIFSCCLTF